MKVLGAIAILAFAPLLRANDFASNFAVVMIDDETESKFGAFPYDRAVMARAVEACVVGKAKAVVLKFFFDQAKSPAGDAALHDAMTKIPVALQARLESTEGTTQRIPSKFSLGTPKLGTSRKGDRGWIPLPALIEPAVAVGFVDFDSPDIPLVEEYRGVAYKSLVLCCLELAVGVPAHIDPARKIYVGTGYLPVNASNEFRADISKPEPMKIISFERLLSSDVKKEEIEGRVVIIGLDSAKVPTLQTAQGKIGIHRFFTQCVAASYRTLMANQSPDPTPAPGMPPAGQKSRQG